MDTVISFTPNQVIELILAISAGIVGVSGAVGVLVVVVKKLKSPNDLQNQRIEILEKRCDSIEKNISKHTSRIGSNEEGNRIVQRALLALLSHGIDGNDIDGLRSAKRELTDFLTK